MLQWELQATQSFPFPFDRSWWEKKSHCAGTLGWRGCTPGGQLQTHACITSYLSRRGYRLIPGHMCQCPAAWLWSRLPTASLPPQGQIQVRAITSLRLKPLSPFHQGLQMLLAAPWPLTYPMRAEKKSIKPPVIHSCQGTNNSMTGNIRWYALISPFAWDPAVFIPLVQSLSGHFLLSRWCCWATAKGKYHSAWQGQE